MTPELTHYYRIPFTATTMPLFVKGAHGSIKVLQMLWQTNSLVSQWNG
jgi:hypothetical protein